MGSLRFDILRVPVVCPSAGTALIAFSWDPKRGPYFSGIDVPRSTLAVGLRPRCVEWNMTYVDSVLRGSPLFGVRSAGLQFYFEP